MDAVTLLRRAHDAGRRLVTSSWFRDRSVPNSW
jgi:hypothetical protein